MWVIDDKSRILLANTGDLAYIGEPLIVVTASFILDVSKGAGSVFKYFVQKTLVQIALSTLSS